MSFDWFTLAWVVWIAYFLVVEGIALYKKHPGGTLSEHVWDWFSIKGEGKMGKWWRVRRIALLALMAWLLVHFVSGGYM